MRWKERIRIVVFVLPVLTLFAALLFAAEAAIYISRSEIYEGTVVQRYEWPGETIFDRGAVNYEPIFTYVDGGDTVRASVGASHSSFDLEVGETGRIRAVPGDRGNVRIDSWQGLWFVPVVLAGFGLSWMVVALVIWAVLQRTVFRKEKR